MKKIFDLEEEITLMEFDNNKKGYENISGKLILFKDDKILGIMDMGNMENFIVGNKRDGEILIHNILDNHYMINLSNNTMIYKKDDREYPYGKVNFNLKTVDFDLKKVDILNRKIMDHKNNKDYENNNVNRALTLKK